MDLKVDGRPFNLEGREYIVDVIRDMSPEIVIPKAAQTAFTISFLVRTAHWITQYRWHHLYLLPVKQGAIPFVQARIDPIIDSSPVLREVFSTVDNRLHKQSKEAISWYIRGTNINRELQEIPVDVEVWDEYDRMVMDNLDDALHRMDGSNVKKLTKLSTPTVPGHGVDADDEWHKSDMHRWSVPCPHCNRFQIFNFDDNVRVGDTAEESIFVCSRCHKEISDEDRWQLNKLGEWVAENAAGRLRGYHINQFNSPTQPLVQILSGYFKGQTDTRAMKSFLNNNLGLPYVAEGDQFTPELLDKCRLQGHSLGGIPDGPVFVGIDIGTKIHLRADVLTRQGFRKAWAFEIFDEWNQVDNFLSGLVSFVCVCDAHPEKRAARDLSLKYPGRFWIGFEQDRDMGDEIALFEKVKHGEACKVSIDRTMAFDTVIHNYMKGRVLLPYYARDIGEEIPNRDYNGFYYQMIQQARVEEENTKGIIVARWQKNRNKDHWHHADMFCQIATLRNPGLWVPAEVQTAFNKSGGFHGQKQS
jgi:Phage terminase large subunit gpA, ATPase domain/Terminase large subunit gpA, endonuclease domain